MKKSILVFLQVALIFISGQLSSQTFTGVSLSLTPNGIFDVVQDNRGNSYQLAELALNSSRLIGGVTNSINSVPSESCTAGYFTLFYAPSSIFTQGTQSTQAQTDLCEVFTNISALINSNIPNGSINILCNNTPSGSSFHGLGTSYYVFPGAASSNNQGIILSQVQKALMSGVDPYSNIPVNAFVGGNNFYHGSISANSSISWNFSLSTSTLNTTDYSFYSAMLHEAMHLLAVTSLIDVNGNSKLSQNYFSLYDQFLYAANGYPLLTSPTSSCPTCSLSYNTGSVSLSAIAPSLATNTTNTSPNVSTCSTAAQYSSTNVVLKVYTPDLWEDGSSLSHFEDMCTTPTFTPSAPIGCVPTPTAPGANDLYFVMSNSTSPGSCYIKNYFKKQERCVLCDVGYSVNTTYTTNAWVGATTPSVSYSSGCTSTAQIIGLNDGLNAGVYTYSTTGTTLTISLNSLLSNDTPSTGLQVTCVEVIYNNATFTVGTTNLTVTAVAGAGFVLLKYLPTNGSGKFGNATYIFCYFIPGGCNLSNACNMVQNGGFESSTAVLNSCGSNYPTNLSINCWDTYIVRPDLLYNGSTCSSISGYKLGVNTLNTTPPVSTLNIGSSNTKCVGLVYDESGNPDGASLKTTLSSPMTTGQTYKLSFWIINHGATTTNTLLNPSNYPIVISVASNSVFAFTPTLNFPNGLNPLAEFTVNAGSTWSQFTYTFNYGPSVNANAIVIGINGFKSTAVGSYSNNSPQGIRYCFLDEVSIVPNSGPTFSIPQPTVCGPVTYTNLIAYTSVSTGTFSGEGVSVTTGGVYNFNDPPTLGSGNYNIAFTYSVNGCLNTIYHWINAAACCGNTSAPVYTGTAVPSYSTLLLNGPYKIANDFTVQANAVCDFYGGEFIMSPNVKITVAAGGVFNIQGAHLYTCGSDMWKGIVVKDGGQVNSAAYTTSTNLVEDAETAIDASNQTTSSSNPILYLNDITFNKNYTDINITNYSGTNSNAVQLNRCVFSCRDFTFTSSQWPQSASSDLRNPTGNPSTSLSGPYLLQNTGVAYLKYPYPTNRSHVAIQLTNVGTTTGTMYPLTFNGLDLSAASSPTNFNLYDSHESFISSINSNMKIINSVFQNTQTFSVSNTPSVSAAIQHSNNNVSNFQLDLAATSPSLGNHFYDCALAVNGISSFNFKLENATFRSTQTKLATTGTTQAVIIKTNQAVDYNIKNNEFTNVHDGVIINFFPAPTKAPDLPFYADPTQTVYLYAVYIRTVAIHSNTFSPEMSTFATSNNYVKNPIALIGPCLNCVWTSCTCNSITVIDNLINRAYNGIKMDGLNGYTLTCRNSGTPKIIATNSITLEVDYISTGQTQKGIEFVNSTSLPINQGQKIQTVEQNTLSVYGGTVVQTYTNISLFYGQNNGALSGSTASLYPTPHILCNVLSNAHYGFLFSNGNRPSSWRGNKMQDLAKGITLTNAGEIGKQGDANNPINNEWNGSWPSGNWGTWVANSSTAQLSPLFLNNGSPYAIPTSSGNVIPSNLYGAPGTVFTPTAGSYACGSGYTLMIASPLPEPSNYDSDELLYIANTSAYRYLAINDSMKTSDGALNAFYDDLNGSSIDKFNQLENKINSGDFSSAESILETVDGGGLNRVETNYHNFYVLYLKYMKQTDVYTPDDIDALSDLAGLCPGTNGSVIYQARSLFNLVTGQVYNGPDGCTGSGARSSSAIPSSSQSEKIWDVDIFPNPATNQLSITSKKETENLGVTISDLSGRLISTEKIKTVNFIANLELNLINGAYFITISSAENEKVTKKLLIAK